MNREFLNEAINLFDMPEKWGSFLELSYKKEEIKNEFFKRLQTSLNKKFTQEDLVAGWSYKSINSRHYRWFLNDFGEESCCILFHLGHIISLRIHPHHISYTDIKDAISTEKYASIINLVNRQDEGTNEWELIREIGDFHFNSPYDGHFNEDRIAWFAGNKTEEFIEQIAKKVNRIRRNPELTQLLRELNETCKK